MRDINVGIKAFEEANTALENEDFDRAKTKFASAKEALSHFAGNGADKISELLRLIDKGVAATTQLEESEKRFISAVEQGLTPEAPPADPGVWSPPPVAASKTSAKRATLSGRKSMAPNSQGARTPTTSTSGSSNGTARKQQSVDNGEASADKDKEDIDQWTLSGEYDRSLVAKAMSMKRVGSEVKWDDIIGLEKAKEVFRQTVILPALMPKFFTGIRRPANAVLMFGPPGTGKTLLAQAVATERKSTFFLVQVADLASKWRGDAEKMIKLLFEMARASSPSTIFIDEIDGVGTQRGENEHEASRRLKVQLLVEMDGFSKEQNDGLLILAATNAPWYIDEALRRRFVKRLYVDLPDLPARRKLLENTFDKLNLAEDVDLNEVARDLEGYSPADVAVLCRQAALAGITRLTRGMDLAMITELTNSTLDLPITNEDIHESIESVKSSVDAASLQRYTDWSDSFGSS